MTWKPGCLKLCSATLKGWHWGYLLAAAFMGNISQFEFLSKYLAKCLKSSKGSRDRDRKVGDIKEGHTCNHAHACARMHTPVHSHVQAHTYTFVCTCICLYRHTHNNTYICACIWKHIYAYTHTFFMCIGLHVFIHTFIFFHFEIPFGDQQTIFELN